MVIMDIILLLSLAWCGREDGAVGEGTYHLVRAGLLVEPCLARDAHESRVRVGEKKFTINKLKRWEEFGGEAAGAHGPSWPLASGL